ncbi:MAG: hypothetical protein Ta2E_01280 [Mycoplasmoidaceae bacterium]|nr:MAG: hypothetical protein Ta2E_01280 [Mycoplasmoidaceae bacterium]
MIYDNVIVSILWYMIVSILWEMIVSILWHMIYNTFNINDCVIVWLNEWNTKIQAIICSTHKCVSHINGSSFVYVMIIW